MQDNVVCFRIVSFLLQGSLDFVKIHRCDEDILGVFGIGLVREFFGFVDWNSLDIPPCEEGISVQYTKGAQLEFLENSGLMPGRSGVVLSLAPDGTATLEVDDGPFGVGGPTADLIVVTPAT